jgi:hypothetical protein
LSPAGALALKLVLTPVLVGAASLAGRRWGPAVGGWLIGIPFTSGPIAFFLALSPGPRFAAAAAVGIMAGAMSQAAFCLAYSWVALRSAWALSLLAATIAYAAATVVLDAVLLPVPPLFGVIIVVLVISLVLMPGQAGRLFDRVEFPRWDIPARIVVATSFVIVLTAAAPLLGARLAGLLAPFPLSGGVLAGFAHRIQGADPAVGVLRGLLLGLFAFATFFLALTLLLPAGIAVAFALAIAAAVLVQGASLLIGRRVGLA